MTSNSLLSKRNANTALSKRNWLSFPKIRLTKPITLIKCILDWNSLNFPQHIFFQVLKPCCFVLTREWWSWGEGEYNALSSGNTNDPGSLFEFVSLTLKWEPQVLQRMDFKPLSFSCVLCVNVCPTDVLSHRNISQIKQLWEPQAHFAWSQIQHKRQEQLQSWHRERGSGLWRNL